MKIIPTPYAHNPGSFMTFDEKTKTLFSSDLFGSFTAKQGLFLELDKLCFTCEDYCNCPNNKSYCPLPDIIAFHKNVIPCRKALQIATAKIKEMDIAMIAPQHGCIINRRDDICHITAKLESLEDVGIDGIA